MPPELNNLPTDSELEILNLLWEHGESSVRFINDLLNEKREVGYTTTLKIMQIMNEKGLVKRNTEQKIHLYKAVHKENKIKNNLLTNLIDTTFNGSAQSLIMAALGNQKVSKNELNEIKNLIDQIEKNN
jgi:predicted transcriptional regulator